MRALSTLRRRYLTLLGGAIIVSLFTACGASASGGLGAAPGTPVGTTITATATASSSSSGAMPSDTVTAALNGCPVKQAPSNATAPTDAVVVKQSATMEQHVSASQGQALVVQLRPELRWTLNIQDPNHTLAPSQPNGWYDAGLNACVWRFVVVARGTATLTFGGAAICQGGTICPHIALEQDVTVSVS